jgi:hypothetical protein
MMNAASAGPAGVRSLGSRPRTLGRLVEAKASINTEIAPQLRAILLR